MNPTTSSSFNMRRENLSHVVIDLNSRTTSTTGRPSNSGMSLSISQSFGHHHHHRRRRRRRKRKAKNVKSALIMVQQVKHNRYLPWEHDSNNQTNTDRNHIQTTMLNALNDFPKLTVLTIDLSYWKLRVATLSGVIQATKKTLKELTLRNLILVGNLCDQNELENVLLGSSSSSTSSHSSKSTNHTTPTNIQCLVLQRCRGTATVRTLLTSLRTLRKVQIIASRISQSDVWASVTLVEMCCRNPRLRSLTLHNVLGLEDQHIFQMVEVLRSSSKKNNNNKGPMLNELRFTSAKAGEIAGEDILSLLQMGNDRAVCHPIAKLTLNLGGKWNPGPSVGRILSSNNTALRKLELRITGTTEIDSTSIAKQIAIALSSNQSKVTHLQLNMDLSTMTAAYGGQFQEIQQSFEACLKLNDNLESLRFCDTSSSIGRDDVSSAATNGLGGGGGWGSIDSGLTPFLRMKLDLNRSGLLRLLHNNNNNNNNGSCDRSRPVSMNSYLKAMTRANQNLSVLFYALHNNPALFCFGQVPTKDPPCHPFNLRVIDSSPSSSLTTSIDMAASSTKTKLRERHHRHHHCWPNRNAHHQVAVKKCLFQHLEH